eukprot:1195678-Prorocentrum_minimum.AAC.2
MALDWSVITHCDDVIEMQAHIQFVKTTRRDVFQGVVKRMQKNGCLWNNIIPLQPMGCMQRCKPPTRRPAKGLQIYLGVEVIQIEIYDGKERRKSVTAKRTWFIVVVL